MMSANRSDIGKFLLRTVCGGLLLFHGSYKVFNEMDSTIKMVESAGLPGVVAYGAIVGEFIAPIFLILGYFSRIAALVIAFNMFCTIAVAHRDIAFQVNDYWGWMIELNVFFMMAALACYFLGSGRLSISRGEGRWD
jgi:putative oxidoreductase